eukprot:3149356-Rhodomonas_salina.5
MIWWLPADSDTSAHLFTGPCSPSLLTSIFLSTYMYDPSSELVHRLYTLASSTARVSTARGWRLRVRNKLLCRSASSPRHLRQNDRDARRPIGTRSAHRHRGAHVSGWLTYPAFLILRVPYATHA